jgi:hypothetical protein
MSNGLRMVRQQPVAKVRFVSGYGLRHTVSAVSSDRLWALTRSFNFARIQGAGRLNAPNLSRSDGAGDLTGAKRKGQCYGGVIRTEGKMLHPHPPQTLGPRGRGCPRSLAALSGCANSSSLTFVPRVFVRSGGFTTRHRPGRERSMRRGGTSQFLYGELSGQRNQQVHAR